MCCEDPVQFRDDTGVNCSKNYKISSYVASFKHGCYLLTSYQITSKLNKQVSSVELQPWTVVSRFEPLVDVTILGWICIYDKHCVYPLSLSSSGNQ